MAEISFSNEERETIVAELKSYMSRELGIDIGGVDAEFLLDFFSQNVGAHFYNRGLYDAQALLSTRMDEIGEAIVDLEKPVSFR